VFIELYTAFVLAGGASLYPRTIPVQYRNLKVRVSANAGRKQVKHPKPAPIQKSPRTQLNTHPSTEDIKRLHEGE